MTPHRLTSSTFRQSSTVVSRKSPAADAALLTSTSITPWSSATVLARCSWLDIGHVGAQRVGQPPTSSASSAVRVAAADRYRRRAPAHRPRQRTARWRGRCRSGAGDEHQTSAKGRSSLWARWASGMSPPSTSSTNSPIQRASVSARCAAPSGRRRSGDGGAPAPSGRGPRRGEARRTGRRWARRAAPDVGDRVGPWPSEAPRHVALVQLHAVAAVGGQRWGGAGRDSLEPGEQLRQPTGMTVRHASAGSTGIWNMPMYQDLRPCPARARDGAASDAEAGPASTCRRGRDSGPRSTCTTPAGRRGAATWRTPSLDRAPVVADEMRGTPRRHRVEDCQHVVGQASRS